MFIARKKVFLYSTCQTCLSTHQFIQIVLFCIQNNKDANLNWHINIIKTGIDSTGSRRDMIFANYSHPRSLCRNILQCKVQYFCQKQLSKFVVIDISY